MDQPDAISRTPQGPLEEAGDRGADRRDRGGARAADGGAGATRAGAATAAAAAATPSCRARRRPPPADPNAPPPPPADPNAPPPPPADPNAPPPPPADPNAPPPRDPNAPPPPPPPEPGRVDNAAGGLSYVVPAGWKVSDSTQLSYGQALLTKIAPEGAQPPNDTSVLLGRLDLKLFAGAETDNTKAAQRLASDMGEFFMPFPGTRINQQTATLDAERACRASRPITR